MPSVLSLSNWRSAPATSSPSRATALRMLFLSLASVAALLWTDHRSILNRPARSAVQISVAAILLAIVLTRRPSLHEAGLKPDSWLQGTPQLLVATMASVCVMVAIAPDSVRHGDPEFRAVQWMAKNFHIDVAQQVLLQVIVAGLLRDIFREQTVRVSALAASIFGLLHAPNIPLMGLTGIAALYWCEWFRRHRNLAAVVLSHAVLACAAIHLLGLEDLRVGIGYLARRR